MKSSIMYISLDIIKHIITSTNYPSKYLVNFISVCKQLGYFVSPIFKALLLQECVFAKPFFPNKLVSMTEEQENHLYDVDYSVKICIGNNVVGKVYRSECYGKIMWIGYFSVPHDVNNAFIDYTYGDNIDNKYLELFNELNRVAIISWARKGKLGWDDWADYSNLSEFQCKFWDLWTIVQKYKSK